MIELPDTLKAKVGALLRESAALDQLAQALLEGFLVGKDLNPSEYRLSDDRSRVEPKKGAS